MFIYPVKVGVRVFWHIVVEDDIDSLNIHATPEEISSNHDTFAKVLECLILCKSNK